MDDYISRESAIALTDQHCFETSYDAVWMEEALRNLQAADVRPVVRGHYVGEYDGYADGNPVYDMWYCSECGCCFEDWDEKPTYNYCPNCGADMRPEPPKERVSNDAKEKSEEQAGDAG